MDKHTRLQKTLAETTFDRVIGLRLRKLRLDHDLSLEEAGQVIGVAKNTIDNYETGYSRLTPGKLIYILHAYGVHISDFLKDFDAEQNLRIIGL